MYPVETTYICKDMVDSTDLYGLSNFKPTRPYYQPEFASKKAVVWTIKDATPGDPIMEFVALSVQMFSYERANQVKWNERDLGEAASERQTTGGDGKYHAMQ